jgi:hypothetical protein
MRVKALVCGRRHPVIAPPVPNWPAARSLVGAGLVPGSSVEQVRIDDDVFPADGPRRGTARELGTQLILGLDCRLIIANSGSPSRSSACRVSQ